MSYLDTLDRMNKAKKEQLDKINISIISNINTESYLEPFLNYLFYDINLLPSLEVTDFQKATISGDIHEIHNAYMVIIWINLETFYPNILIDLLGADNNKIEHTYRGLLSACQLLIEKIGKLNIPILWVGFDDYPIYMDSLIGNVKTKISIADKLNDEIKCMLPQQAALIDLQRLVANIGIANAYSINGKYRWNNPYSKNLIEEFANEIYKQYLVINNKTKKCVVLDCDNVLWGGILSEDGIEKIKLANFGIGKSYQEFQRYILAMHNMGVIVTVCSKNDIDDVLFVFNNHTEMILKEEHIACFKVNWENKVDNIKSIAEFLNIGLDSMVFIDDSDFEIQAVKDILPEVTAIKYTGEVPNERYLFNLSTCVDMGNIRMRNETYKSNQFRSNLQLECQNYNDYLLALETRIAIKRATPLEFGRISELTQRTNKCTNGKRYTVTDILSLSNNSDYKLYSITVSDRFGDMGIVGAVGILNASIDLFSLSCRALGRNIEIEVLDFVLIENSITCFFFKSTGKNDSLRSVLENRLTTTEGAD